MELFQRLDKWCFDIEQEFNKNHEATPKQRRQYMSICSVRDKVYDKYLKEVKDGNRYNLNMHKDPTFMSCNDRRQELRSAFFAPKCGTGETNIKLLKEGK